MKQLGRQRRGLALSTCALRRARSQVLRVLRFGESVEIELPGGGGCELFTLAAVQVCWVGGTLVVHHACSGAFLRGGASTACAHAHCRRSVAACVVPPSALLECSTREAAS